jgi:hypothetical protein
MKNKPAFNLVGIILIYALFALAISQIPPEYLSPVISTSKQNFAYDFQNNAYIVLGVSFACMVLWFILGEWVIQPFAAGTTWYLTWFLLFAVVVGTAVWVSYLGPKDHRSLDPLNYDAAGWYLGAGVLSFYLTSVFFSPTSAQYRIWPAKLVRVW